MRYLLVFGLILSCFLSACAPAPEAPPDPTPKPTWTLPPHGVVKACLYFDGELVVGRFDLYNESEEFVKDAPSGGSDCTELVLTPGFYWIDGFYWEAVDCPDGCYPEGDMIPIEIEEGDVIDLDVEVVTPK